MGLLEPSAAEDAPNFLTARYTVFASGGGGIGVIR